ncbi:MAG: dockerin type I domain-containing protein [Candidatus Bathyarchaeota archaeon]|nr:dockerin type I domain-containing protein [Candidatus Bathyarchaeota archaeon]MDH5663793.1 dockerin type I domain-containing protein [Candidatus Bathyarchaeota archaeon]
MRAKTLTPLSLLIVTLLVLTLGLIPPSYAAVTTGEGKLIVYTDPERTNEVTPDEEGNYPILPNTKYYFKIIKITEYENTIIWVHARYNYSSTEYTQLIGNFSIGKKPSHISFNWTIPDLLVTDPPIEIRFSYLGPMKGDVDCDGKVDSSDLLDFKEAYGAAPSKPNWNPNCDFNSDDKIDASDLFDLSKNYGKEPDFYWACARAHPTPRPPRLLLVIPEAPLGAIGALIALFLGAKLKAIFRRKNKP